MLRCGCRRFRKDAEFSGSCFQEVSNVITTGSTLVFQSVNYPEYGIGTGNPDVNLVTSLSAYVVRPALNGQSNAISLESVEKPGFFLRHQDYRIRLHQQQDAELYRNDASWILVSALTGTGGVSLQSTNYPNYYIRHRNYQFWLDRESNADLYKKDASFVAVAASGDANVISRRPAESSEVGAGLLLKPGSTLSFQSVNYPDRGIGAGNPDVNLVNSLAAFVVRPALNGQIDAISLESVEKPGFFLRHQNSRIRLHEQQGSELYRNDASWVAVSALAGTGGVSFRSTNYPRRYIRHRNSQFWLDHEGTSDLYKNDASFLPVAAQS